MEFPDHKRSPNIDRISNLPTQILDLILSYLPARDIVRTSILSTDWRHKWVAVPNLMFDGFPCYSISESKALASIIDHVLLLHTGPIEIFKIEGICALPEIDRWVAHVCQRSIKELVLNFGVSDDDSPEQYDEQYELPSCLCHCGSLVDLKLSYCLLTLPPCFEGLKCSKCLCLVHVTLEKDALQKLISSCPLLEELTFIDYDKFYENLKIDAPNLECLRITGGFSNITFGHPMDELVVFSLDLCTEDVENLETSLTDTLTNLPSIQGLALKGESLFCFSSGLAPETVPIQCDDLFELSISFDFSSSEECLAALYLFRCSPNLTELEIEVGLRGPAVMDLWGDISECCWEFGELQWIKVVNFDVSNIVGGELEFVQFLLASSPMLEKMTLTPSVPGSVDRKVVKHICGFERASDEAEIIYDGILIQQCS